MEIVVTQDFIDHRTEKAALYNKRGRSHDQFLKDLDAEIYEHYMISTGDWQDEDDWRVDAYVETADGIYRFDVKFISKWYNISCTKMLNHLQQEGIVDGYNFMEWVNRPDRPLEVGDTVEVRALGVISYDELRSLIRVSRGKWGGFYADVRTYLAGVV